MKGADEYEQKDKEGKEEEEECKELKSDKLKPMNSYAVG